MEAPRSGAAASASAAPSRGETVGGRPLGLGDAELLGAELDAVEALREVEQRRVAAPPDLVDDRGDPRHGVRIGGRVRAGQRRHDPVDRQVRRSEDADHGAYPRAELVQRGDRPRGALSSGRAVHDQPRGGRQDLGDLDQAVGAERLARLHEIDDPLGEADERRQLDRAVEPDHLDLDAALGEVPPREIRILGRDPDPGPLRGIVALPELPGLGDHQPAHAEPEVERLVDIRPLLEQDVLPDDPEVRGAVLDVGRHVERLQDEEAEPVGRVGEQQPAAVVLGQALEAARREARAPAGAAAPSAAPG